MQNSCYTSVQHHPNKQVSQHNNIYSLPNQIISGTSDACSISQPFSGNGIGYVASPPKLIITDNKNYLQPWSGYTPACTLHNQTLCNYFPVQTSNIKANDIYNGIEVQTNKWMDLACEAARISVEKSGGPFGSVIVQIDDETNEVIRYWVQSNHVSDCSDPTAHAEICAIRSVCRSLGVYELDVIKRSSSLLPQKGATSHCEIYASCEPCPMCYSAIFFAKIPTLFFAATRYDAAQQGLNFPDEEAYIELDKTYPNRQIKCYQCTTSNSLDAFNLWKRTNHSYK